MVEKSPKTILLWEMLKLFEIQISVSFPYRLWLLSCSYLGGVAIEAKKRVRRYLGKLEYGPID